MSTKKKVTGYKIDFTTNTIVMNYKFAAAAQVYNSPEYKILKGIKADFPSMKETVKAGRTVTTARPNKRLTYENMAKHISVYENAAELLGAFEQVKALSKPLASPYQYVVAWFTAQFPNYKTAPTFQEGKVTVLPVAPPALENYKQKTDRSA